MERFKKIFAAGVIFVTVLSMSAVVAPEVGAVASAGDLIKMSGLSSVYYLAADGKRYVFPNESTYFSWYSDFSGVVTIPQSELESYPLGANVTVRPGTKLVKITTNPKVYAVISGGNLLAIPDEATAAALYGSMWNKRIIDVSDAFFTNYKISTATVSSTAYPQGSLVKFGTSADVFYINADGTASKIVSEAALAANRFKNADIITAPSTIVKPTVGADITGAVATLIDTSSGAGGTIGAGTGLTVALASDTPASATVITNTSGTGQARVPFTKVNFTASADGDVKVTSIKFKRTGISADADIESLYLYEGNTRLTVESTISSNYVTFNNAAGLFTVTKGTTKGITLMGDMLYSALSGKTIGFNLVAAADVITNGASVSGSFPAVGNLMSTANATDLGRLAIAHSFPSGDQTVDPDTKDYEVSKMTFQATDQTLSLEKLIYTEVGSVQQDDLTNFKLYDQSNTLIGSVANMTSDYQVVFDLSAAPYTISKGTTKTLSLRADIAKGSTRTFTFTIQNKYDVLVRDTSYNVYTEPYNLGSFSVIQPNSGVEFTINSGSLSIARSTNSPTSSVILDGTGVTVGAWDFRASGEDMKVKDLTVTVTTTGAVAGGLDNGKVYVDGVQVGTTKDLTDSDYDGTGTGITTWGFGSTFVVKAGTTAKVTVVADIKTATSTSFSGNETLIVSVAAGASDIQRMSSLSYQAVITAVNGSNAALAITSAALTMTKYSGYGNQTVVAGTNAARLGSFVLGAGSTEGVNLSSITVAFSTVAANAASTTNMYLKNRTTGAQIGTTRNVPGTSNIFSVSPSITIPAAGAIIVDIYGDIKSGSNAGSWIANVDADGSGTVTGAAVSATAADIQTITVGTGSLTTVNGSMPDSAILLAGSTGNYVAQFSFSAASEGFTIDKLRLKVPNNFATSTAGVEVRYTDKAGAAQSVGKVFVTGAQGEATATFTGLNIYVPANGDTTINVYVDLTSIASGAASGAFGAVSLDFNEGFNATGDSGSTATIITTGATADLSGNNFYVRKSKPTFAKLDAGTDPVNGAMYKFSVVADNAGNIDIKQLSFTVATTECNVADMTLYDSNAATPQLTDTTVDGVLEGGVIVLLVGAVNDDVLTIGTTAKTLEVRGTVTGYSASGDSITVGFKRDVAYKDNGTAYALGADGVAAGTINKYNVWSDRSASAHTTVTADWTNGFLIKDMSSSQSFTK